MKLSIKYLAILLMVPIFVIGSSSGCGQKTALKGKPPAKDYNEQSKYGLVSADERKPIKLPPMTEPSFAAVIDQFKADVAANRGDPEVLARKKKAIADPDLLWDFNFVVPKVGPYIGHGENRSVNPFSLDEVMFRSSKDRGKPLYMEDPQSGGPQYKFLGEVFYLTEDQEKRMDALGNMDPPLTGDELHRRQHEIAVEGLNPLTAAKYFQYQHGHVADTMAIDYAERAMEMYPNSAEVMLVWAKSQPSDREMWALNELVTKFPNFAKGHELLGRGYFYNEPRDYESAIQHFQKAMQLDSRIDGEYIGRCYYRLSELEKTIAFYQSLPEINYDSGSKLHSVQLDYCEEDHDRYKQVLKRFAKEEAGIDINFKDGPLHLK